MSSFEFSTIDANPPSWKRAKKLAQDIGVISLTRALEYELITGVSFDGRVLDIGGGQLSPYRTLLNCTVYESINISTKPKPTWVIDAGGDWPCEREAYDHVIALNTLEHIYDGAMLIQRMYDVTAKGGLVTLATPFLFPIHGAPDDFVRYTPSWFDRALRSVGFEGPIEMVAVSWGPLSTGLVCSGVPGPGKLLRLRLALYLDLLLARRRSKEVQRQTQIRHAVGFFVRAKKL